MSTQALTLPPKPPTTYPPVTASSESHSRRFRVVSEKHDEMIYAASFAEAFRIFSAWHPDDPTPTVTELR